jgi:dynein heavy chain, axonemal
MLQNFLIDAEYAIPWDAMRYMTG